MRGDFLRAYTHTLRQTFEHVYLIPASTSWRESSRTTFVLIGTDTPLDLEAVKAVSADEGESRLADQLLSESEVDALLAKGSVVSLTDQYAPVDQMLAPVVRGEETQ